TTTVTATTSRLYFSLIQRMATDVSSPPEYARTTLPLPMAGHSIANLLSAISSQPSAVSHQPSAVSHQPSDVSRQPSGVCRQPSAVRHQPSAAGRRRSVASGQRPGLDRVGWHPGRGEGSPPPGHGANEPRILRSFLPQDDTATFKGCNLAADS